jgi:hypothetical protein
MRMPFETILAVRERLEIDAVDALFRPNGTEQARLEARLAMRISRIVRWMGEDVWQRTTDAQQTDGYGRAGTRAGAADLLRRRH